MLTGFLIGGYILGWLAASIGLEVYEPYDRSPGPPALLMCLFWPIAIPVLVLFSMDKLVVRIGANVRNRLDDRKAQKSLPKAKVING